MSSSVAMQECLPGDGFAGSLVGRAWIPGAGGGPAVVAVDAAGVFDITRTVATTSDLFDAPDPVAVLCEARRDRRLGTAEALMANADPDRRDPAAPWLLAPIDLQAIKAAGVTFAASMLERVVEEQTRGDPVRAAEARAALVAEIGVDLSEIRPGSPEAQQLRQVLTRRGLWSQYLEVGIGPDAEVFTKSQPMSAVGFGAEVGIHPGSTWNNPEPEVVVVVDSRGRVVGAALGNDVNLRDFEGRSALLLGKAKDNNASCAIGPFVRLLDDSFTLDDIRTAELALTVEGEDQFVLRSGSSMSRISRDVLDLVAQTAGKYHQYPDGFVLFLGTMFAPTEDRGEPGGGFTHKVGDLVTVSSPKLGALVNRVRHADQAPPWTFGVRALMRSLRERGIG